MNDTILKSFTTTCTITVVEVMKKIDLNEQGILFVINDSFQLIGCITDGDVRRWLIKTGTLDATVDQYMNCHPKFLFENDRTKAMDYMKKNLIKAVPVVDLNKQIIDIVFADDAYVENIPVKDSLKNTSVIIMAGGRGTRLYPYTKILPKPLIPIKDIPILERIINQFCQYGISQYYLTVNYKKGMIKSYFSDLNPDYHIHYIEEDKPLGTAGSIKLITDKFDSPVIITNCDTLINADYEKLINHHVISGNALTIVSALKNMVIPYGIIHSQKHGFITYMEEKPQMNYFVNTGLYVLNPELIKKIPDNTVFHMTHLADMLIKEKYQVGMYPVSEESFLDMGEFEEMKRMEQKLNLSEDIR